MFEGMNAAQEVAAQDSNQESLQTQTDQTETSSGETAAAQSIVDLDSVEKFKFAGREWTPKDFQGAYMMQSDYTKKTQALAEERKYYDNLQADLAAVKTNPSLAAKFKAIYPEKFHAFLGYVTPAQAAQIQQAESAEKAKSQADPELLERLERIEGDFRERKIQAINAELDAKFKTFSGKYPMADEDSVVARAQALLEAKRQTAPLNEQSQVTITDKEWDDLWKSSHDRVQSLAAKHYSETVNKQKNANKSAKDVASGGGIGGQAPKQPRSIREASRLAHESGAFDNL